MNRRYIRYEVRLLPWTSSSWPCLSSHKPPHGRSFNKSTHTLLRRAKKFRASSASSASSNERQPYRASSAKGRPSK